MIWVSCERGLIKPDRRAFEDMFSMFNLKPQECFFIDDTEKNVISYFDTHSYQWYT
ncbi:MAG: HAD-IA family hydrolase [Roseburia sp.]|nr:HAD-IA family hydrolase [Roseburia sp.]